MLVWKPRGHKGVGEAWEGWVSHILPVSQRSSVQPKFPLRANGEYEKEDFIPSGCQGLFKNISIDHLLLVPGVQRLWEKEAAVF